MKLNLGCGPHTKIGFENLDLMYGHDLTKKLNYPDYSIDFVLTEHFVEHITKQQFASLMSDLFRLMKDEAIMLISTPDLEFLCNSYSEGVIPYAMGWRPASLCDMVNEGMREWGHQYLWDEKEMIKVLNRAGFFGLRRIMFKPEACVRPYCGDLIFLVAKSNFAFESVESMRLIDKYVYGGH